MERSTALEVWTRLEEAKLTDLPGDPPSYDVRLDASTDSNDDRDFRVRVTPALGFLGRDDWLYVMEAAAEFECEVDIQNSGMELR